MYANVMHYQQHQQQQRHQLQQQQGIVQAAISHDTATALHIQSLPSHALPAILVDNKNGTVFERDVGVSYERQESRTVLDEDGNLVLLSKSQHDNDNVEQAESKEQPENDSVKSSTTDHDQVEVEGGAIEAEAEAVADIQSPQQVQRDSGDSTSDTATESFNEQLISEALHRSDQSNVDKYKDVKVMSHDDDSVVYNEDADADADADKVEES
jgi:hypothetical protein